jgi:hypothetical protein
VATNQGDLGVSRRIMMRSVEESDGYVLVRTSDSIARFVRVVSNIGHICFGAGVHRTVYQWTAECVERLGLQEKEIALFRGCFRHADAPNWYLPGKRPIWGTATTFGERGSMAVFYSPRLARNETRTIKEQRTGVVKEINTIELTILHELLHLRYPEKTEKWVRDRAYGVFFAGWQAVEASDEVAEQTRDESVVIEDNARLDR